MPLNTTASHGRCSRASANAPRYALAQQVAPSNSTKTLGSFADSPARICVTQLFTCVASCTVLRCSVAPSAAMIVNRSEEHTSELQSHSDLVCRLLLEK